MAFRATVQLYDWLFPKVYSPLSTHSVSASSLPWLFVGIELTDGTMLDRTSHVQDLVNLRIPITRNRVCGDVDPQTIQRCFYLDEKTLKEEEFPADGITIHDS
jgi:hypothetical protein